MFKQVRLNDAILKFYQRSQPIAFSNAESLYDDLVLLRDQILMYGDLSEAQTSYLNDFIEKFDTTLINTVTDIFEKWLNDGFLVNVIRTVINEEVIGSRDGEPSLNLRLNRDKQDTDTEINLLKEKDDQFTAELEQKVGKGEVSVSDIDKNLGKLDQTYMTDDFLQQIAGTTPINAVPADGSLTTKKYADKSITMDKLSNDLAKQTINVFNTNNIKQGYLNSVGTLMPHAVLVTTEIIPVNAGDIVAMSNRRTVAQYDENGNFIESGFIASPNTVLNYSMEIPITVKGIAVTFDSSTIDNFMITINNPLPNDYIAHKKLEAEALPLTEISDTVLDKIVERTSNVFDNHSFTEGKWLQLDGTLKDHALLSTTHRIPVKPGDVVRMSEMRIIGQYDYGGAFLPDRFHYDTTSSYYEFVVPSGTYGFAVTFGTSNKDNFMITINTPILNYEPFYKIKDGFIPKEIKGGINLPKKIYATVGEDLHILNRNITREKEHNLDYNAPSGSQLEKGYVGTYDNVGEYNLTTAVFDRDNSIENKSSKIVVSLPRTSNLKVLIIGDSTVNNGRISEKLNIDLGSNITLLGTRGVTPNLHEGRGGWTVSRYLNTVSFDGITNPFFNPVTNKFDLAYYLSTTGQSTPDVIIWQLGINDTFNGLNATSVLTDFDGLLNSVKVSHPSIKQAINITIPPTDNLDNFGLAYNTGQSQWRYKYINFDWVQALISHYDGNVDLISTHISLDTSSMIADGVHPTSEGYDEMAKQIRAYLNSI